VKPNQAINISDLRRLAKSRLPRVVFDFLEGGVEDEHCLARNLGAFRSYAMLPRYLVDISIRSQASTLFGREYASRFGIAPTGAAGLFRPGADQMLAEAAAAANIPFILSGANNASIETVARISADHIWYQLYAARDPEICADMVRRALNSGIRSLVLTVDVPVRPKRERNLRNGFGGRMVDLRPDLILDAALHPSWTLNYFRQGYPMLKDWAQYASPGADAATVGKLLTAQFPDPSHIWKHLETYRRLWPHTLIVKGIMRADDARRAAELGVDGIIVSNHGGRQLDQAPSSIEVLQAIVSAVGAGLTVMVDGGIRRGADILIATALGAKFCFVGRPTLYGVTAGGVEGVSRAIEILRDEIDIVMAQVGCTCLDDLGLDLLMPERERANTDPIA
jgi:(S)-mandelate dehydrogenase